MAALYNNVLYLCGTSTVYETYTDFIIRKKKFHDCYINKTALDSYLQIKNKLFEHHYKIYKIVGWSIGSMIAIIFSYDLFINSGIKKKMYLFGVPPIGDKSFQLKYNKYLKHTTLIFNNKYDYIANPFVFVPFYLDNLINYHHVGKKIIDYKYNYSYPIVDSVFPHLSYF